MRLHNMKKLIILLTALLLLCACSEKDDSSTVIVEEFVGKDVQEVYTWCGTLDDNHSCEISFEDNSEYEKDIVFEQSEVAGHKLKGDIHFKVSSGSSIEIPAPHITEEVTLADIEVWKEHSGLRTLNVQYETSDTVEKNHVIRLEPDKGITKDTPVTVYVSSGPSTPASTTIEVKYGDYIGLSVDDFVKKGNELGLSPNHQESRDKYDPNVKIGNVVWHGSGIYEKGETFNYGICIDQITVTPGQYVGMSESNFISTAQALHLNPVHISGRDCYSASVPQGYIVTHGNGVYVENEDFKYGLSYGPAVVQQGYEGTTEDVFLGYLSMLTLKDDRHTDHSDSVPAGRIISYNYGKYSTGDLVTYYVSLGPEDVYVDVPDFSGSDEQTLLNFLSANGLLVASRSEEGSLIPKGNVVRNDSGSMKAGSAVSYTISTGPAVNDHGVIDSLSDLRNIVDVEGDYNATRVNVASYFYDKGFTNVDISPKVYAGFKPGYLLSVTVGGTPLEENQSMNAKLDSYIEVTITSLLLGG